MKSLPEILSILESHKAQLYRDYPIKTMAVFGSYARGDYNLTSDLDLLVEFNSKVGVKFIDLADEVENILGIRVDLVSKNGVKEKYLRSIHSDLIYV
jgi:predicted nucleotidyltransferase